MAPLEGRTRITAGVAALTLVVGGAWLSTGETRLMVLNDAMRIFYPWTRGLGSLLCAGGLVLLTATARRTWVSVPGLLLAAAAVGGALFQWTYRVEADAESLAARRFFITRTIAWREVTHVGQDTTLLQLQGRDGRSVSIDTTDMPESQRQRLGRTISRRIHEASGSIALVASPSRPPSP